MIIEWWQRAYAPTYREAHREAIEEMLENTWEERYEAWCREHHRDPEDNENVHAYEEEWNEGFTQ